MEKNAHDNFYKSLVNNPKEIIAWCKREIKAYEKLIKLIQKNEAKRKDN